MESKQTEPDAIPSKKINKIGIFEIFKYASAKQKVGLFIAIILSIIHGVTWPFFGAIFGKVTSDLTPDKNPEAIEDAAGRSALFLFGLAFVTMVSASASFTIIRAIGIKITENIKKAYFRKILEMDVSWFDLNNPEKITPNFTEEIGGFSKGCGTSLQIFFFAFSMGVGGVSVGFVIGWLYSLYITLTLPIMFFGMGAFIHVIMKQASVTKDSYAKAGANAE